MTTAPKIKAILPYFGGKRTLAERIVAELGDRPAYWEPFCGSLAVLFAKPRSRSETVNDLNRDVVNLARVVADPYMGPQFESRVRVMLVGDDEFSDAKRRWVAESAGGADDSHPDRKIARAVDFFVVSWMGRNGSAGTRETKRHFCVRYTANGGDPATRFRAAVASIPAWFERLQRVTVLDRDAFELLDRIDDSKDTAIYCDPPYLRKSSKYVHDFSPDDHGRLANALARFKRARVVVSYYDDPRLGDLYPGWTIRRFDVSKALGHQGTRGANDTRATEVLLLNGPSLVELAAPTCASSPGLFA